MITIKTIEIIGRGVINNFAIQEGIEMPRISKYYRHNTMKSKTCCPVH